MPYLSRCPLSRKDPAHWPGRVWRQHSVPEGFIYLCCTGHWDWGSFHQEAGGRAFRGSGFHITEVTGQRSCFYSCENAGAWRQIALPRM